MFLQKLRLYNFKNHAEVNLTFEEKINCFLGKNGSGKTNLLDAIYYLSFTKSAFNQYDLQNVRHDQLGFLVKGTFEISNKQKEVICSIRQGEKKSLLEDDQEIIKFSGHVGKYPVVLIAPQDIELIWDGSELRRKFFDVLISQLDRIYLNSLIQYNHHLKQRNSLLRTFSESGKVDADLIASYDLKLALAGDYIYKTRRAFIENFKPIFSKHYDFLVREPVEKVEITYKSDLTEIDFELLLKKNLQRDLLLQRTTTGVHRDDFLFTLNELELKRVGSQGQQKSFLIALKLAEFQILATEKQVKPILLLDDIFDKLDDLRIQQLLKLINQGIFGQLFITDARQGRSQQILMDAGLQAQLFIIESGTFRQEWLKT
ncbi:MAG: DNA replication and repair protein RecF [Cyclobacteriaceae bacterium]|nr:DNA replication and repair protein RecF [Cyclobacteriaceae bacterium]